MYDEFDDNERLANPPEKTIKISLVDRRDFDALKEREQVLSDLLKEIVTELMTSSNPPMASMGERIAQQLRELGVYVDHDNEAEEA